MGAVKDTAPRTYLLFKIFNGEFVIINRIVNALHSVADIRVVGCFRFGRSLAFGGRFRGGLMSLLVDLVA